MSKAQGMKYLHYFWRPHSSGKIEKADDIIKKMSLCRLFLHTDIVIDPHALELTMCLSFQPLNRHYEFQEVSPDSGSTFSLIAGSVEHPPPHKLNA